MRLATLLIITAVSGLYLTSAHAQIYKWVDEHGKTVYSQLPPPGGSASRITPRPSPVSDEAARKRLESLQNKAENRRKNREIGENQAKLSDALAKRRKANCATARANLKVLEESARVRVKDAQGNPFYLDEENKQKKTIQTRAQVKEFCH